MLSNSTENDLQAMENMAISLRQLRYVMFKLKIIPYLQDGKRLPPLGDIKKLSRAQRVKNVERGTFLLYRLELTLGNLNLLKLFLGLTKQMHDFSDKYS